MQVFEYDYKKGKGRKLGETYFSGTGERIGIHRHLPVHQFYYGDVNTNEKITADTFNVRAIICCTGAWEGKWEWIIIPNNYDADLAIQRNKDRFGVSYWVHGDKNWGAIHEPV